LALTTTATPLKYVDVIFASKDASSYSDQVGDLPYKTKIISTWLEQMATNDAANHIASGVVMPFFQASAPTGWTKSTANDDAVLRVTSGSGGGSGGTQSPSTAHTHDFGDGGDTGNAGSGSLFLNSAQDRMELVATGATFPGVSKTYGGSSAQIKYIDIVMASKDA
jgi:hypothetical protein